MRILSILFIILTIIGCDSSGGGSSNENAEPPFMTAVYADIEFVKVRFSKELNPATVNTSTIIIKDNNLNTVAGSVTYDSSSGNAVYCPDSGSLNYGVKYTVYISRKIKDISGNLLARNYVENFKLTRFEIFFWNNHLNRFFVEFNKPLNLSTIAGLNEITTTGAIRIKRKDTGEFVPGKIEYRPPIGSIKTSKLTFYVSDDYYNSYCYGKLFYERDYTAIISADIEDVEGNKIYLANNEDTDGISFTTPKGPDDSYPHVISYTVSTTKVVVYLSERLDPTCDGFTYVDPICVLDKNNERIAGHWAYNDELMTLEYLPAIEMQPWPNYWYYIFIPHMITDLDGYKMLETYKQFFELE